MPHRSIVFVFAKPPRAGRVKTRLQSALSPREAAEVHRACIADTVRLVASLPRCERWLLVAGSSTAARKLARAIGLGKDWRVAAQGRGDLGERLARWFRRGFGCSAARVLAVGTDSPWIGRARLREAFAALARCDVALGPTDDGGYYLVGARRWLPEMFRGIAWGTEAVLRQTQRQLQKCRASVALLTAGFDLDRPADLRRAARLLARNARGAPALARWLRDRRRASGSSRRRRPLRRGRKRLPVRA
jgi:uncharacterized protein